MVIRLSYKYRIYPNNAQKEKLSNQFGCARFVYNFFLRQRIDFYAEMGKKLTYDDMSLYLTAMKKEDDFLWLKKAHSQVLQISLRNLDRAYNNFFNNKAKFPVFKKKNSKQSCSFPQGFRVSGNNLYVPKVGLVSIKLHRAIVGEQKNLTISKTKSGKYFASIQTEQEMPEPEYSGSVIGLDLGIKDFAVLSSGEKIGNPKYFRKSENRLKKLQRRLSKTKNGSKGRERARLKVAQQYEKITNQRKDFLHKLSKRLTNENQVIAIEDLNIKGMAKNRSLAKSIHDAGWYEFTRQLEYKGVLYGCKIEKINRFFPSSKRCSTCGFVEQRLHLSDRSWVCQECGTSHDRDVNAAKNILIFYTAGVAEINADGQNIRLSQESQLEEFGNCSKQYLTGALQIT